MSVLFSIPAAPAAAPFPKPQDGARPKEHLLVRAAFVVRGAAAGSERYRMGIDWALTLPNRARACPPHSAPEGCYATAAASPTRQASSYLARRALLTPRTCMGPNRFPPHGPRPPPDAAVAPAGEWDQRGVPARGAGAGAGAAGGVSSAFAEVLARISLYRRVAIRTPKWRYVAARSARRAERAAE
jgi:hypothetical protein